MNFKNFVKMNEGGARIPKIHDMTAQEFRAYFRVGMNTKASYRPAHWQRAVDVMNVAIQLGYVKPMDFGRGKGKYTIRSMHDEKSIDQVSDLVYKSKDKWIKEETDDSFKLDDDRLKLDEYFGFGHYLVELKKIIAKGDTNVTLATVIESFSTRTMDKEGKVMRYIIEIDKILGHTPPLLVKYRDTIFKATMAHAKKMMEKDEYVRLADALKKA